MFEACIFISMASLLLIQLPSVPVLTVLETLHSNVGIQSIFFP